MDFQCFACQYLWSPWSLESVIRLGFWPGSPSNIIHIFDINLFQQWDLMQKRMPGVSERAFLKSLEDYSFKKGRVCLLWSLNKVQNCLAFSRVKYKKGYFLLSQPSMG